MEYKYAAMVPFGAASMRQRKRKSWGITMEISMCRTTAPFISTDLTAGPR